MAYGGCSFCATFFFCCESDLYFLPQSPLTRGAKKLIWKLSEASSRLSSGTVLQDSPVSYDFVVSLPCQIKHTDSTSLLGSAALFTKKEKTSAALLSMSLL